MKYKAGDKVKIREDLEEGDCYLARAGEEEHLYIVTEEMAARRGQTVTIRLVTKDGHLIKEDGWFTYTEDMFAGKDKSIQHKEDEMGYVIVFILGLATGFFIAALCQIQKKDKRDEK